MTTMDDETARPEPYPRLQARAQRICRRSAQALRSGAFPPWYVRWAHDARASASEALALGTLGGVGIAVLGMSLRERLGERALATVMTGLSLLALAGLACWIADCVWRYRHPGHAYLDTAVRERALRDAADFYGTLQSLLDGLVDAYGADQVARLKLLIPANDAAAEERRGVWSVRRRTFRREYDLALARWQADQEIPAAS